MEMVLICFVVAAFFSVFSLDFILNRSFFFSLPVIFSSFFLHTCSILVVFLVVFTIVTFTMKEFRSYWPILLLRTLFCIELLIFLFGISKKKFKSILCFRLLSVHFLFRDKSNRTEPLAEVKNVCLDNGTCCCKVNRACYLMLLFSVVFVSVRYFSSIFFLFVDFTIHGGTFDSHDVLESLTMVVMVVVVQAPKVSPFYFSAS